jgi:hypothetical protein
MKKRIKFKDKKINIMNTNYDKVIQQLKQFSLYDRNGKLIKFQIDAILKSVDVNLNLN